MYNGPVAQLVRAPPCHGGGRGFEPHPGRQQKKRKRRLKAKAGFLDLYFCIRKHGILAQLGEHLPYKQGVTGSSPVGPTTER